MRATDRRSGLLLEVHYPPLYPTLYLPLYPPPHKVMGERGISRLTDVVELEEFASDGADGSRVIVEEVYEADSTSPRITLWSLL